MSVHHQSDLQVSKISVKFGVTMNAHHLSRPLFGIRVIGSITAAFVGCLAGAVTMEIVDLIFNYGRWPERGFMRGIATDFAIIGVFVFVVWLLILLPLYLLAPRSSKLWRPWICAGLGGLSGAVILLGYFVIVSVPPDIIWLFLPSAITTGAVTCLIGASTTRFFDESH
jgi:hypothetical protein